MKNIVIFGAPGSGKGTQSDKIVEKYGFKHISTGDVLRGEIKNGTELGKTAKEYIDNGQLIPDSLMIDILAHVYDSFGAVEGVIFDGFPRTIPQAEALDNMGVEIQHVINIDISDEKIINRMSGRRVCENCGRPFHIVTLKPKKEGVCDDCGGTLVQRKDDHPDTVLARLETYHKETEPLVSYYEKQGKLVTVKGQDDVEATTKAILEGIEA